MADCAKTLIGLSGQSGGDTAGGVQSILRYYGQAISRLKDSGRAACIGSCSSGTCQFGLTQLHVGATEVDFSDDGAAVTITVHGDGKCFCGS